MHSSINLNNYINSNSSQKEHNNNNNSVNLNTLSLESQSNYAKSQKTTNKISDAIQINKNKNNGQLAPKLSQSTLYLQHLLYPSASKHISSFAALSLMASKTLKTNQEAASLSDSSSSKINNNKKHKCDGCDKVYTKSK